MTLLRSCCGLWGPVRSGGVRSAAQAWRRAARLVLLLCLAASVNADALAGDAPPESLLPSPACHDGWILQDDVRHFGKGNLYEYINGEAELFFPFGFDALVSATYGRAQERPVALVVDVYRLSSGLNAFGVFSSYRKAGDKAVSVGSGATVDPAQLLFYQNRYFVRISVSGASEVHEETLLSCALALSRRIPGSPSPPAELALLALPGITPGTQKYTPASLLGYPFFRRGLTADLKSGASITKAFVVLEDSADAARKVLGFYDAYLRQAGEVSGLVCRADVCSATDPLYGPIALRRAGSNILGLLRFNDTAEGTRTLDAWAGSLSGR